MASSAAGCHLGVQYVVAAGRSRFGWGALIDNQPFLLMRNGELCTDNLARSRVTADDVRAKLRAANVTSCGQVHTVRLETTGDVSVLHSRHGNFDEDLLADVRP